MKFEQYTKTIGRDYRGIRRMLLAGFSINEDEQAAITFVSGDVNVIGLLSKNNILDDSIVVKTAKSTTDRVHYCYNSISLDNNIDLMFPTGRRFCICSESLQDSVKEKTTFNLSMFEDSAPYLLQNKNIKSVGFFNKNKSTEEILYFDTGSFSREFCLCIKDCDEELKIYKLGKVLCVDAELHVY